MSDNDTISRKAVNGLIKEAAHAARDAKTAKAMFMLYRKVANLPAVPQEMSAREFVKACLRMCNSYEACSDGCPLQGESCELLDMDARKVAIVAQWAADHPEKKRKTYAEDFREKYPNANLWDSDYPLGLCRKKLYGQPLCEMKCRETTCSACWNEEMEEQE